METCRRDLLCKLLRLGDGKGHGRGDVGKRHEVIAGKPFWLPQHNITKTNIDVEPNEFSSRDLCHDAENAAATGGSGKLASCREDGKLEVITEIATRGAHQGVMYIGKAGCDRFRRPRLIERQVNIACRPSLRSKSKLHRIATFKEPGRMRFVKESSKQSLDRSLQTQPLDLHGALLSNSA
jgi:hypothetical protein